MILLLVFLFLPISFTKPSLDFIFGGRDIWSEQCTKEKTQSDTCHFWKGMKISGHVNEIASNPEITKNMTFTELKMYCDDRFVCLENTYCYKDSYNYRLLDECIEDVFQKGPMLLCDKKLREVLKRSPNKLSLCVKEFLEKSDSKSIDCEVIQKTGQCYLPDVEKHCYPEFLPIFKEHLSLRLYNLACDGRLRYRVGGNTNQNELKNGATLEQNVTNLTNSTRI